MATDAMLTQQLADHDSTDLNLVDWFKRLLEPVASLKLTVILFAASIFLILAGTFAQVDKDIWEVIGLYFRVWMAWVPFQIFFTPTMFESGVPPAVPGGIYFPGGKTLGLLIAMNLVSAHLIRFKAVAKGGRLLAGWIGIAIGCVFTWAIVAAGSNSKGIQAEPLLPYRTQWIGYQGALGLAVLVCGYGLITLCRYPLAKSIERWSRQVFLRSIVALLGIGSAALLTWILLKGDSARPSDASLRILWQLTQGTVASIALLGGCWVVFGQRAGVVLLHGGIGLMMFYELHVALTAIETQMNLAEGERSNYVQDIRTTELAISDITNPEREHVIAIPKSTYLAGQPIDHPDLPFKIEISMEPTAMGPDKHLEPKGYIRNAKLRAASARDKADNLATTGLGLVWFPERVSTGAGTDNDSKIDMPAAYVTLTAKSDGKPLGTYLASMLLSSSDEVDTVLVDGKTYKIELRPKRYYKSFQFELKDVRKEDYLGTSTPRSYASTVHIVDQDRKVDDEKTIWMNNPLRFENETFYQSSYFQEPGTGIEHTTLSVVANSGWMMPYVGCMLVGVGMLFHFLQLLTRFLLRGDVVEMSTEDASRAARLAEKLGIKPASTVALSTPAPAGSALGPNLFAATVAGFALIAILSSARAPSAKVLSFDFYRFGQIPVVSDGRTKPLATAAANSLLAISGRTKVTVGDDEKKQKLSAIEWLVQVITEDKAADDLPIFRVENLDVMQTIGVRKNESMRYSRNQIASHEEEFEKQVKLAIQQSRSDRKKLGVYEKKLLELNEKVMVYDNLKYAFGLQYRVNGKDQAEILESLQRVNQLTTILEEQRQPVFAVGPTNPGEEWHTYARAWLLDLVNRLQKNGKENKAVEAWEKILKGYAENKPAAFNQSVDDFLTSIDQHPPRDVHPWVIRLESYFNHFQPFFIATWLYLVAFILGAIGWLVWPRGMNRAAFCLLAVIFILHTGALVTRLIISGRPPVTNLYSSAIFIGWGCVLLGLLFELIYQIGIGNLVAAVAGFATLQIADRLALDGDTFTVLQAVLDTQFWLATHVTCITLGYATTYLAGLFGVVYILRGTCTPSLSATEGREINRMIYGTLCFSIFFSFVGTVLGGLWADDSWGRFWGWDPKENGALIIVLWNALALHARWGGMVRERGLAALAVAGNIFVSWSWWGVNALGAGLHAYGFTKGVWWYLGSFILFNLLIIGVGMLPKQYWWSLRRRSDEGHFA